jgi:hypothetical protein
MRAVALLAFWVLAVLPVALGWQRCAFAALVHRPCPGCGMTRAIHLLEAGNVPASLRMHPLALPVVVAGALIALSTLWTTLEVGTPFAFYQRRLGRAAIALAIVVYAATFALWCLRWLGFFGGPVVVSRV